MFKGRAPRRAARREIILQTHAGSCRATLRNVSSTGVLLETDGTFRTGEAVAFDLLGRRFIAKVASTRTGRVALVFTRPLPMRDLKLLYQS